MSSSGLAVSISPQILGRSEDPNLTVTLVQVSRYQESKALYVLFL